MRHSEQVLKLLQKQIGNDSEVKEIQQTAADVVGRWVNPLSGGAEEINGLVYGLVQSGKTGVLSVTGAMGADEGYKTLIILTSDSDPLYDQTLGRVEERIQDRDRIDWRDVDESVNCSSSFLLRQRALWPFPCGAGLVSLGELWVFLRFAYCDAQFFASNARVQFHL
jgi:hypothetical protein